MSPSSSSAPTGSCSGPSSPGFLSSPPATSVPDGPASGDRDKRSRGEDDHDDAPTAKKAMIATPTCAPAIDHEDTGLPIRSISRARAHRITSLPRHSLRAALGSFLAILSLSAEEQLTTIDCVHVGISSKIKLRFDHRITARLPLLTPAFIHAADVEHPARILQARYGSQSPQKSSFVGLTANRGTRPQEVVIFRSFRTHCSARRPNAPPPDIPRPLKRTFAVEIPLGPDKRVRTAPPHASTTVRRPPAFPAHGSTVNAAASVSHENPVSRPPCNSCINASVECTWNSVAADSKKRVGRPKKTCDRCITKKQTCVVEAHQADVEEDASRKHRPLDVDVVEADQADVEEDASRKHRALDVDMDDASDTSRDRRGSDVDMDSGTSSQEIHHYLLHPSPCSSISHESSDTDEVPLALVVAERRQQKADWDELYSEACWDEGSIWDDLDEDAFGADGAAEWLSSEADFEQWQNVVALTYSANEWVDEDDEFGDGPWSDADVNAFFDTQENSIGFSQASNHIDSDDLHTFPPTPSFVFDECAYLELIHQGIMSGLEHVRHQSTVLTAVSTQFSRVFDSLDLRVGNVADAVQSLQNVYTSFDADTLTTLKDVIDRPPLPTHGPGIFPPPWDPTMVDPDVTRVVDAHVYHRFLSKLHHKVILCRNTLLGLHTGQHNFSLLASHNLELFRIVHKANNGFQCLDNGHRMAEARVPPQFNDNTWPAHPHVGSQCEVGRNCVWRVPVALYKSMSSIDIETEGVLHQVRLLEQTHIMDEVAVIERVRIYHYLTERGEMTAARLDAFRQFGSGKV
ncbi:hypothetical protein BDZ89DRAFT_1152289 [Hymenopellis radicata]|nr:hypothetical protein BDZ89DRAFT_1152289 [Hymenopellis radicata]